MVSQIKVDSVLESSGNGVTVDGVLIKDNVASGLVKLGSATASNDSSIILTILLILLHTFLIKLL